MDQMCHLRMDLSRLRTGLLASVLLLLLAGLPAGLGAAALKVTPTSIVLDSAKKSGTLTITNDSDAEIILQQEIMKWVQDDQGKDAYQPTTDLVFYPHILKLGAGQKAIIRVGYQGAGVLAVERCFRLFAQELPVKVPGETAVKIAVRISIPVFLMPTDPHPDPSLGDLWIANGKLQARFVNSGNTHFRLQKITVLGLDPSGREVFSHDFAGWSVLPQSSWIAEFGIVREECERATILKIVGTSDERSLERQYPIDAAYCAQLAEGRKGEKADANSSPPAKP